jgi:hypothetical protein
METEQLAAMAARAEQREKEWETFTDALWEFWLSKCKVKILQIGCPPRPALLDR